MATIAVYFDISLFLQKRVKLFCPLQIYELPTDEWLFTSGDSMAFAYLNCNVWLHHS